MSNRHVARRVLRERWGHLDHPPAPRQAELMAEGWSRQDAEHLCVLELAMDAAAWLDDDGGLAVLAHHAGIALQWDEVFDGAEELFTSSDQRLLWAKLARFADDPIARVRMLDLAAE